MATQFEPIVGRYMTLELGGRPHRIYFEQAGEGIPLLCLHTAGADGRQFRHLMLDDDITRHYRVLAFDMPGTAEFRSMPVLGSPGQCCQRLEKAGIQSISVFASPIPINSGLLDTCWTPRMTCLPPVRPSSKLPPPAPA
jgi:hypothetical protein